MDSYISQMGMTGYVIWVNKTKTILLVDEEVPILHEDRAVLAIDKPAGWILAPSHWSNTDRNLQREVELAIAVREHWAQIRNLKFLRFVHRLDGETTGVLLGVKSQGALKNYSELFESRRIQKKYLAIVKGIPKQKKWNCDLPIGQVPGMPGRMRIDRKEGKEAETTFELLETRGDRSLIAVWPLTGRTHQIRIHLKEAGLSIIGDPVYGSAPGAKGEEMGLRAVELSYQDPFQHRPVRIQAPTEEFRSRFGFPNAPKPSVPTPLQVAHSPEKPGR